MANSVLACASCMRRLVFAPLAARALSETSIVAANRGFNGHRAASTKAAQPKDFEKIFDGKPLTQEEKEARERESNEKLAQQYARRKLAKIDDPYNLGQAVMAALREGKFDGAMLLTEKASRTMNVVVSWNALLAYQLSKGEVKTAIKTFNNMKKRGQMPNVQTFTTIFSGLTNCPNTQLAVAEAVKHYHMLLQDSRLEANIIHTNAVLRLCSQARDLDQMLLIASTLDNKARAPDSITYTTLLEGIRYKVLAEVKNMEPQESERYRKEMADKAMVLWSEVVKKWKAGRLVVDERLVVAMARTYPFQEERNTKPEDNLILDMLHEMMGIPNFAKYPEWNKAEAERREAEPLDAEADRKKSSKGLTTSKSRGGILVKPGTRTLGLILEVIGASRRSTLAIKYWNKLVDEFGVHPDHDNYFRMLVLLKSTKSSSHIVWLLKNSHGRHLNPGHFSIGLEACINDNINTNAVDNAWQILERATEVMPPNQEEMMKLHRMYLRVALVSHHAFRQQSIRGEDEAARTAYGRQILKALENLQEPYKKLQHQWFEVSPKVAISDTAAANLSKAKVSPQAKKHNNASKTTPLSQGQLRNAQREVVALARNMYAAYNKLMVEKMLPEKELDSVRARSAGMNRAIQRFYSDRSEHEPNLPPMLDPSKRDSKRRGRLSGAASAKDLTAPKTMDEVFNAERRAAIKDIEGADADQRIAQEADRLASEVAPAEQDLSGVPRVGAEFVWSTRSPMGPKKGVRASRPQDDGRMESRREPRRVSRPTVRTRRRGGGGETMPPSGQFWE